jgi:type III secretion protein D
MISRDFLRGEMYELRVLSGLHHGTALPLIGEQWVIGCDGRHDLLLQDPGIAQRHCLLTREAEHWRLEAEDGSLIDSDGNSCDSLDILIAEQRFQLGGVQLTIMASSTGWPLTTEPSQPASAATAYERAATANPSIPPPPRVRRPSLHKRLLIAGLVVTVAGSAWALSAPARLSVPKATSLAAPPPAGLNANDTVIKLQAMLRERELRGEVTVIATANGVELHGSLRPEQLALYQRMLERFGLEQRSTVALIDHVEPFGRKLPFDIVQISSGKRAHVVLADSRRLFLGDEVDGLRLTKIDNEHVEFDGDQHYEIKW